NGMLVKHKPEARARPAAPSLALRGVFGCTTRFASFAGSHLLDPGPEFAKGFVLTSRKEARATGPDEYRRHPTTDLGDKKGMRTIFFAWVTERADSFPASAERSRAKFTRIQSGPMSQKRGKLAIVVRVKLSMINTCICDVVCQGWQKNWQSADNFRQVLPPVSGLCGAKRFGAPASKRPINGAGEILWKGKPSW